MKTGSWGQLDYGGWGVWTEDEVNEGDEVTVTTKAGKQSVVVVGEIVFENDEKTLFKPVHKRRGGGKTAPAAKKQKAPAGVAPRPMHECMNGLPDHYGPCCRGEHSVHQECFSKCCQVN